MTDKKDGVAVLRSAPPPWHSIILVSILLVFCLRYAPTPQSLDDIANDDTLLRVNFPQYLDIGAVAWIRLFFGSIMLGDSFYAVFWGKWEQDTTYYRPHSKLRPVRGIPFRGMLVLDSQQPWCIRLRSGLMTLSSFTMWAWLVEGVAFTLLGVIPLMVRANALVPAAAYRIAVVAWEISAPNSLLVSAIVTYVLWPRAAQEESPGNSQVLKHPGALLEHNLNVVAALVEVGLLGGLPVRRQDFCLAPLFGLCYVLFSWSMTRSWCKYTDLDNMKDDHHGPQFIYPFLDTTLGGTTTLLLVALLAALTTSYAIFSLADYVLTEYLGGGIVTHALAVVLMAWSVCKVRD